MKNSNSTSFFYQQLPWLQATPVASFLFYQQIILVISCYLLLFQIAFYLVRHVRENDWGHIIRVWRVDFYDPWWFKKEYLREPGLVSAQVMSDPGYFEGQAWVRSIMRGTYACFSFFVYYRDTKYNRKISNKQKR